MLRPLAGGGSAKAEVAARRVRVPCRRRHAAHAAVEPRLYGLDGAGWSILVRDMTPGVEDGLDDLARGVERAPGHRGHGRAQHGEIAAAVADGQRVGRRYAMVSGHFKHRHRLGAGRRTQFEITLPLHKPNAGIRAQAGGLSARFRGFVGIGKLQADMPRRDGCRAAR